MTQLFLPLVASVLGTWVLAPAARRIRPHHGSWLAASVILSVFVTVVVTAWAVVLAVLAHDPAVHGVLGWCPHLLGLDHAPPRLLGALALIVGCWGTFRVVTVGAEWRRGRGDTGGDVEVLDTDVPLAYAQTGGRAGIVVSTGMLALLEDDEQQAMLAHERAHLRHRHDRFLVVARLAAGIPPLLPAAAQLRRCLERWADEDAAQEMGERAVVARAIARAALSGQPRPEAALALLGSDVTGRVEALLQPATSGGLAAAWTTAGVTAGLAAVAAASLQLHHLAAVFTVLCTA